MWTTAQEKLLDRITFPCTCKGLGCLACGGLYLTSLRFGLRYRLITEAGARKMMEGK